MSTPANTPVASTMPMATTVTTWAEMLEDIRPQLEAAQNRDARRGVHRVLVTPTGNQITIRVCEPISQERKMPPGHRRAATAYEMMRHDDVPIAPPADIDVVKSAAKSVRSESAEKKDEKKA